MTSEDFNCCLCPFQESSEEGLDIHIEFNHSEIFDPHYQQPEDDYQGPPASMKNENEPEAEQPGPPILVIWELLNFIPMLCIKC